MKRISSIDIARGIVMLIMALDHVRDLMHVDSITQSPTNLETTTPVLFFTRWITYLCAPAFVFLAGTSAYLYLKKSGDVARTRNFLLKRGLYLVVLEFTAVNFAIFFDPGFHTLLFEVIATIGVGFIVLGLLIGASVRTLAAIGLLIVFCHNLLPLVAFAEGSTAKTILAPLFSVTAIPLPGNRVFVMAYPPIPWLGIMLAGYASGKFFEWDARRRIRLFLGLGAVALVLFAVLRFINVYGDPAPWSSQKNTTFTFLSFMNVTKYPPSLQFALVTLGIMLLVLALSERWTGRAAQVVSVYGKVPLFYFLLHFFVLHAVMVLLMFLQGFTWSQMDFASGTFGRPKGVASGVDLGTIYLIWLGIIVLLYKPCLWFGKYKATHPYWWLRYL